MLRAASIALIVALSFGPEVKAAELVDATIDLLGGRISLAADTLIGDSWDENTIWRKLKSVVFATKDDVRIRPDADSPLQATLEGKIKVGIGRGGSAEVTKLRMVRDKETDRGWRIAPEDVEAMLKIRKR